MKKSITLFVALSLAVGCMAVPAKRGLWKMLTTADGRQVRAQLTGDDIVHYYQTADGDCYVSAASGVYERVSAEEVAAKAQARRDVFNRATQARAKRRVGGTGNVYEGNKKGLIILVEFSDMKFKDGHDKDFYNRVANEEGFTTADGFKGSVRDYFKAQSMGRFDVEFDVVGPVTLSNGYAYYGRNAGIMGDARAGEMVAEACLAVDEIVDYTNYDWTGSGEVDQVFVLYAGKGEASGGSEDTIWPHKWSLGDSDYGSPLTLDGMTVDTYACSCEMTLDDKNNYRETVDGIGTICHEFSHCLGYPDMYDTSQYGAANFGMDVWDLMDYGSYNDGGFTPSGYTAYEKWVAGWIEPVELTDDIEVSGLKPVSQGGEAYIIYNSGNNDEFIMLENRQQTGWDAAQPASGLMALHVDYDAQVWYNNTVNNSAKRQRCTIFHADNSAGTSLDDLAGDLYPYAGNDCLNSVSYPKPLWYSADADGKKRLGKSISNITKAADGTVGFSFSATPVERNDYLLLETFDDNSSTGGNDDYWMGQGGTALATDLEGWEGVRHYAGAQCARFGTPSTPGSLTSPEFDAVEGATLTCLAGPWSGEQSVMTVSFVSSVDGSETVLGTFDIVDEAWKPCEAVIGTSGRGRLKFASSRRQFLDEVRVERPLTNGIATLRPTVAQPADKRIYSIDGRYLGDDMSRLPRGIYVVGGKKVVK